MGSVFGKSSDSDNEKDKNKKAKVWECPDFPPLSRKISIQKDDNDSYETISLPQETIRVISRETIRAVPSRSNDDRRGIPFNQKIVDFGQETIRAVPSRSNDDRHDIPFNRKIVDYGQETIRAVPSRSKETIRVASRETIRALPSRSNASNDEHTKEAFIKMFK